MNFRKVHVKPSSYPLEFKTVDVDDFNGMEVKNNKKTILTPDENGFISSQLLNVIDVSEQNTVIVNAGVGQGKTTATISLINTMVNEDQFIIVFIAPSKLILDQYFKSLVESGIPVNAISRYNDLNDVSIEAKKGIHLMTIHAIYGYPGEDALFQQGKKMSYISKIIKHTERTGKKAVFIMDEFHEYINQYQHKYGYMLWKWQPVLHKVFVLTATFTEGSKPLLRLVAELTRNKVQLIESNRLKVKDKQAKLHLVYTAKADIQDVADLVEIECTKRKDIHVLTYSESLADQIVDSMASPIGKVLKSRGYDLNKCTGSTGKSFDINKCNIGTTFKTGININKPNVSYFIILPEFKNRGIFTDTTTISIIQAIGRVRIADQNDIFLILPPPNKIIAGEKSKFVKTAKKISYVYAALAQKRTAEYIPLSKQKKKLEEYIRKVWDIYGKDGWLNYVSYYQDGIKRLPNIPEIKFPDSDELILWEGDKMLTNSYEIFGSEPSSYVTWAAFNEQFENCTLDSVYYIKKIQLTEGLITQGIINITRSALNLPQDWNTMSEKQLFDGLLRRVLELKIEISTSNGDQIKGTKKTKLLKLGCHSFVQLLRRTNPEYLRRVYPKGRYNKAGEEILAIDSFISKEEYLLAAIQASVSHLYQYSRPQINDIEKQLADSYVKLWNIVHRVKNEILYRTDSGACYLNVKRLPTPLLEDAFKTIKKIITSDTFWQGDSISLFQNIRKMKTFPTTESAKSNFSKSLINEFKDLFLKTKRTTITTKEATNFLGESILLENHVIAVKGEIEFADVVYLSNQEELIQHNEEAYHSDYINVIYRQKYPWLESTRYPEEFQDGESVGVL